MYLQQDCLVWLNSVIMCIHLDFEYKLQQPIITMVIIDKCKETQSLRKITTWWKKLKISYMLCAFIYLHTKYIFFMYIAFVMDLSLRKVFTHPYFV